MLAALPVREIGIPVRTAADSARTWRHAIRSINSLVFDLGRYRNRIRVRNAC